MSDLHTLIQRAKSLYSLGRISTYKQAFEAIGWTNGWEGIKLEDKIKFPVLRKIYEEIGSRQIPQELEAHRDKLIEYFQVFHRPTNREPPKEPIQDYPVPIKNVKQKAHLFIQQRKSAIELYKGIIDEQKMGELLIGQAGEGKTYVLGQVCRWLHDTPEFFRTRTLSPYPIVYITKASVVEQTRRVLKNQFGLDTSGRDVFIINYDQLRATFGESFLEESTKVESGIEYTKWIWKPLIHPCVFILDECQAAKNLTTQQSLICQSINEIEDGFPVYQIFSSATPYTRVCEAKCFAVSTRVSFPFGSGYSPLTNNNWPIFASRVAGDLVRPEEYSPAACLRLTETLKDHIVRIKGMRPKFHAKNKTELISFRNSKEREQYDTCVERWYEFKAKTEGRPNAYFMMLVELMILQKTTEIIRAQETADRLYHIVNGKGKSAVFAFKFKASIAKIVKILHQQYGVPRSKISLIWGGSAGYVGNKEKYTQEQMQEIFEKVMMGDNSVSKKTLGEIKAQLQAHQDGLHDMPEDLELGTQSRKQRQVEIDRFQEGKTLYCGYTYKAGGVGLSLHHTDEFTEFKCRRTEAGWPVDEDIPKVPTRPRESIVAPTYSAIELVQGVGRAPRLTSLSDTEQTLLFYRNTIEEQVAATVSMKLKCLREVVQARERWEDIIIGGGGEGLYEKKEQYLLKDPRDEDVIDIETEEIDGTYIEEE